MAEREEYDVLIIGAGAAGLIAGWELVQVGKQVAILEARDRTGGRILTVSNNRFPMPIELGAEFIHGELPLTKLFLKKAGIASSKVTGTLWRKEGPTLEKEADFIEDYSRIKKLLRNLDHDIPVADFLNQHLSAPKDQESRYALQGYVEGYYAADVSVASTYALREELEKSEEEQYRVEGGYSKLVEYMVREFTKHKGTLLLSHPVSQINWEKNAVEVQTPNHHLYSKKILITVPLGVLQSGQLRFSPAIPEKITAVKSLGFGPVIKIILQFEDAFWKQKEYTGNQALDKLSFLFSEEAVPTWWTQHPKEVPLLTGWLAGPRAKKKRDFAEEEILQIALSSLGHIFNREPAALNHKLKAWQVTNWAKDQYCCGGYSFEVVGGAAQKKILKTPIDQTVFFAGEGLHEGIEIGTVEAALVVGRDTAHQIIASF